MSTIDEVIEMLITPRRAPAPATSAVTWDKREMLATPAGKIVYWSAGSGPPVVLVHGWEGAHADLDAFVAPLLERGKRVVALDLPAHGESPGTLAAFPDMGLAVGAVGAHVGPLAGVIAHSAGCPSTALAIDQGLRVERVALIATPERYGRFVRYMAGVAGVDPQALIAALMARGIDVPALNMPRQVAAYRVPALIVHSADDRTTEIEGARKVAAAWPGSMFLEVDGLGHSRILRDPAVIARIVSFISG
jgi:pimeloyl-ACP methyl ester carboxylesterase